MDSDLLTDFKSFQELVQSSLVDVTRSAGQVASQDLGFHRSSSEKLSRSLDRQNAHLLRLTNNLLKAVTKETPIKAPSLQEQDDIDDSWRRIVDVVDHLLEKSDSALDEFSGVIKRQSPALQDTPQSSPGPVNVARGLQTWSRDSMQKPQQFFAVKPDNFPTGSFKPLLQTKPHAIVPLAESIGDAETGLVLSYFAIPSSDSSADTNILMLAKSKNILIPRPSKKSGHQFHSHLQPSPKLSMSTPKKAWWRCSRN